MGKLKRLGTFLLAVCITAATFVGGTGMTVSAEELTEGYYTYEVTDGEATITSADRSISGDIIIPDSLGGYPVTKIGQNAFYERNKITSVVIPETVTAVEDGAFYFCDIVTLTIPKSVISIGKEVLYADRDLENIFVDDENPVFCDVDGILFSKDLTELLIFPASREGSFTVPSGVTKIGDQAFQCCEKLTEIKLPEGLEIIGERSFSSCDLLTEIKLPESLKEIGGRAFAGCINLESAFIPKNVTNINGILFSSSSKITSIDVDEDNEVYSTIDGMLYETATMKLMECPRGKSGDLVIPEGTKIIGDDVFFYCSNLINVVLPEGLEEIGMCAFQYCHYLESINLPDSIVKIGISAFYECRSLEGTLKIPTGVTVIEESAFAMCGGITEFIIPEGIEVISKKAFWECYGLKSVALPTSLKTIEDRAFEDCYCLESLIISEGVKSIGDYAFYRTSADLKGVTISKSVTSIGEKALGYADTSLFNTDKIEGFTIYGYEDSAAEEYATANEFTFVNLEALLSAAKGDVNCDGKINSTDFMQVRRHFLSIYTIPTAYREKADVNGDGKINSTDFMQIRRHFLGLYTIGSSENASIIGEWDGQMNYSGAYNILLNTTFNEGLGEGTDIDFANLDGFVFDIHYTFNADGTYEVTTDENAVDEIYNNCIGDVEDAYEAFLTELFKDTDVTVEEYLELMETSLRELADEIFSKDYILNTLESYNYRGSYSVENGNLYECPEDAQSFSDSYTTVKITANKLTFVSYTVGEEEYKKHEENLDGFSMEKYLQMVNSLYPMEFTRA